MKYSQALPESTAPGPWGSRPSKFMSLIKAQPLGRACTVQAGNTMIGRQEQGAGEKEESALGIAPELPGPHLPVRE